MKPYSQEPATGLIPSQMNPVHNLLSHFSQINFNIIPSSMFSSSKWCLTFRVSYKNVHTFLIFTMRATFPVYVILFWFYLRNNIWRTVQIMKLLLTHIFLAPCHFLPLMSKHSLRHNAFMFLSRDVRGQVSGLYKTTGKLQFPVFQFCLRFSTADGYLSNPVSS